MANDRGLTVAVTGAGGYIAGRLIHALLADERIGRVLGFDLRRPDIFDERFVFDTLDIRSEALAARVEGTDVVVHLAFVMDPIHDETEMRDINVNGSQNVFSCAGRAGVKRLVYTSSATVYGAHPDNDFPLTEDSRLRANLDFSYPAHKLEVEYIVREFREEHPEVDVVVFRPAIVFGPNVDNAWSHALEAPLLFSVRGYEPPLQFVHEDDVARALAWAVTSDVSGIFNLAPDDYLSSDEMIEIVGRRRAEIEEPRAFAIAETMWRKGLAEAPAGMLHYVMHPWVVSNEALTRAGFRCERSAREAFADTVARTSAYVRLGGTRLKRADVARAAVGVGVVGAAVAAGRLRKRR